MHRARIAIDAGEHHVAALEWSEAGGAAHLWHDGGDRRSRIHDALLRHVRVTVDGRALAFDETDRVRWQGPLSRLSISLGDLRLAEPTSDAPAYALSPLECRFLADNGAPHPAVHEAAASRATPLTDLHSHFAGCVSGEALVEMAARHDVVYPRALLSELGIHAAADAPLSALPPELLPRIGRQLSVPHDRQITFLDMERLYRRRAPLTKHPDLLIPQLARIAADYARAGVRYAELSLSDVVRADVLRAIHRALPPIERRHGVALRFLAAMSRHDDLEWDLDVIDRLEQLAGSAYVVGADFMGHETSSTRAFGAQLTALARRMSRVRPGFVVRVHAGENPAYPNNVRDALELVGGADVRLRIGHGLYGVDDATLDALREAGAIIEFNLTSNFTLNNVQSLAEVPLVRYARAGVQVVLGSDGPGLYGTDARLEARTARLAGLSERELEDIQRTERAYLDAQLAPAGDFDVPDEPRERRYGPAVEARKRAAREARDTLLLGTLGALGVEVVDDLDALFGDRRCICVAGSWQHAWAATPDEVKADVRRELERLIGGLDPGCVLVTGGTAHGVEHEVQRLARANGIDVLAVLVRDTPPDAISADVRYATITAETLYAKAASLYEIVRARDGVCIFVGGGPVVNDEIQTAENLRLDVLLMDGPPGASTQHARAQPSRAFRTAEEALARLAALGRKPAPFWHRGVNPTADVVLFCRDPLRVLLIRRDLDAPCEGGKWALPGGFVETDAPRGEPWAPGRESALDAAIRELREETGLDLRGHAAALSVLGTYEGGGRDPRDRPSAWSRSTVFVGWLPEALASGSIDEPSVIVGGDDASDARFVPLDALPPLAFDHARILRDALS